MPKLPPRVHAKHNAYYIVTGPKAARRWVRLCAIADGEAALYEALRNLAQQPGTDMAAAVKAYLAAVGPHLTPEVKREYERQMGVIAAAFEAFNVAQIEPADVREFLDPFADRPGAQRHYKARLSTFLRWAAERRYTDRNAAADVRLARAARKPLGWTWDTYHAVRSELQEGTDADDPAGGMMQCYMDLSVLLLQRTTDVRTLRRAEVSGNTIIVLPSKTAKSSGITIEIPVSAQLRAVLDRAAAISRSMRAVSPFVIHQKSGHGYTRYGIHSAFKRAAARAGVTGVNPKSLRSFAATEAKRQGYTLDEIQVALAHSTAGTTEGYIRQHEVRRSVVEVKIPPKV